MSLCACSTAVNDPLFIHMGGVNTTVQTANWEVATEAIPHGNTTYPAFHDPHSGRNALTQDFSTTEVRPGTFVFACTKKPVATPADLDIAIRYEPRMPAYWKDQVKRRVAPHQSCARRSRHPGHLDAPRTFQQRFSAHRSRRALQPLSRRLPVLRKAHELRHGSHPRLHRGDRRRRSRRPLRRRKRPGRLSRARRTTSVTCSRSREVHRVRPAQRPAGDVSQLRAGHESGRVVQSARARVSWSRFRRLRWAMPTSKR